MVSKITVSILALIGWNLVEWTGDEGKLLKLGELCAIKHSVLRRPPPLWEKKSDASFLWSSLWEGKGGNASFRLLWRVERCQKDLRWLRYDQSNPRLTSAGFAMTKVVPDWPRLASLWSKWSQKESNSIWFRYLCKQINAIGMELTCLQPLYYSFQPFFRKPAYRERLPYLPVDRFPFQLAYQLVHRDEQSKWSATMRLCAFRFAWLSRSWGRYDGLWRTKKESAFRQLFGRDSVFYSDKSFFLCDYTWGKP